MIRMSRYHNGPISDHFDGVRFFNPHGAPPRSRRDLLRWYVDRHWRATKSKWPVWAPSPYADRPPTRVEGAAWRISYVGHASLLVQTAGLNILLDPVWSKRASPFRWAETSQQSRHCIRRTAADRCRAGVARSLRSSRPRHPVANSSRTSCTCNYAVGQ